MKVLIACEESQVVCKSFRQLGFEAYSCDLLDCSGGHPEWHIKGDALSVIVPGCFFITQNRSYVWVDKWDLIVGHPPCTYLTVTGNKWMKPEFKHRFPERQKQRDEAAKFFMALAHADCDHIAIENPVGVMSTIWRKPDQYVHPYHFGDPHSKKTGLWLKGLPNLKPTEIVEPLMYTYKDGRKDPIWHVETLKLPKEERTRARSKTFPGIAEAMAQQWGDHIRKENVEQLELFEQ